MRGALRAGEKHDQNRHYGRGEENKREFGCLHLGGSRARVFHQHWFFGSDGERDSQQHVRRTDDAKKANRGSNLAAGVREAGERGASETKRSEQHTLLTPAQNVDIGLETNLNKCGQIGKGMWAVPDDMLNLLKTKGGDLEAGGSTAWVPSPTGAVIHSIHYHLRNATLAQARIKAIRSRDNDEKDGSLLKLLTPPIANVASLTADVVSEEAKTAVQAILGYVARWIDKGVGCSKVPDLAGVGKMEDRATLRISAQLLINWLHWGIIRIEFLEAMFSDLAKVVEEQNNGEVKLGEGELAREAAMSLVLDAGKDDEYTEKILHRFRKQYKNK